MKPLLSFLAIVVAGCWAIRPGNAQELAATGPVIVDYGPVYAVPDPSFATPLTGDLRVVFDVARSPDDPEALNRSIETLARFLNMHARAGVALERLHVALVLHGGAGKDALGDESYRKRFHAGNPNRELLERLHEAGVRIVLCGQTAASRGLEADELLPFVDLALSAMTALAALQHEGYALIAF